jgi:hypothetical protein
VVWYIERFDTATLDVTDMLAYGYRMKAENLTWEELSLWPV